MSSPSNPSVTLIPPIAYDVFQSANQVWMLNGGPWVGTALPSSGLSLSPWKILNATYCDGYCLVTAISSRTAGLTFEVTHAANISLDMSQFGGGTTLGFKWTYWPLYITNSITAGSTIPIRTRVNDVTFDDSMATLDINTFSSSHTWAGSPFTHQGVASITRVGNSGYISISLTYTTVPLETTDSADYNNVTAIFIKRISFKLTPTLSGNPGVPLPTPSALSSQLPTSSSSIPSALPSQVPDTDKLSPAAIGCIVLGIVVLIAFLIGGLVLYRRTQVKRRMKRIKNMLILRHIEEMAAAPTPYPIESYAPPPSYVAPPTPTPAAAATLPPSDQAAKASFPSSYSTKSKAAT